MTPVLRKRFVCTCDTISHVENGRCMAYGSTMAVIFRVLDEHDDTGWENRAKIGYRRSTYGLKQ